MDQEERQRKLEAGRAKLADFRQRKAKGDSTNPQKKTSKRKGANDLSAEESTVVCGGAEPNLGSAGVSQEDLMSVMDPAGVTDQWPADSVEQSVLEHQKAGTDEVEELKEMLVVQAGKDQLEELQSAVQKRDEIITQLSVNLQVALKNREQVQLEALQLAYQIRALREQLQQATEVLRSHSHSYAEMSQARQHVFQLQHCLQGHASQRGGFHQQVEEAYERSIDLHMELVSTDLQKKLGIVEQALTLGDVGSIDKLIQRLTAELGKECDTRQMEQDASQIVPASENERRELQDQPLACVQTALDQVEMLPCEAQKCKTENQELNIEIVRLNSLILDLQNQLQQEVQAGEDLKAKLEMDRCNFELRLQTLEEEREMDMAQLAESREVAMRRLREEHEDQVQQLKQKFETLLCHRNESYQSDIAELVENSVEASNNHEMMEPANGCDVNLLLESSDADCLMEKYLVNMNKEDSSWVDGSHDESCLLEQDGNYRFEFQSELELDGAKSISSVQNATEQDVDHLFDGQSHIVPEAEGRSLDLTNCQLYDDGSQGLAENSEAILLAKALLQRQCNDLTEQLENKERELEILQVEVQKSALDVKEAVEKWSLVTQALQSVQGELEAEREQRLHCEEIINQKMHEEDNLKNKLSSLQSQQEPDGENLHVPHVMDSLVQELRTEKEQLLDRLREQEQLVRDIQEQKLAEHSVPSEVQAHIDQQLTAMQVQRDHLEAQLETLRAENLTASKLLSQKTLELDCSKVDLQHLQADLEEFQEKLEQTNKEKLDLESRLHFLQQNLTNAEEALSQASDEKMSLEQRLMELQVKARNMENTLVSQREEFDSQLDSKMTDLEKIQADWKKQEEEYQEKNCVLETEVTDLRKSLRDQEQAHGVALEKLQRAMEEAEVSLRTSHQEELRTIEEKHQEVVKDLHVETEHKLLELKSSMEEDQKKQIMLIKQVHEREHQRQQTDLVRTHRAELAQLRAELGKDLQESLEAAHQAELLQTEAQRAMELEALRLSLAEQHASQLELSQSNLQRDKEAALSELQASLRSRWAQESAILQTRQQKELERVEEKHWAEMEELTTTWESRLLEQKACIEEQQATKMEVIIKEMKLSWQQEEEQASVELQALLSATRARLDELQSSRDQEVQRLEEDLNQAWSDRDAAARALEELVATHKAVLQEQQDRSQQLEEKVKAGAAQEQQLQEQVKQLQAEYAALKSSSEQEMTELWSQIEGMRASRQELGELKDQLLARSSCVEDIERLKQDFAQQRQSIQEQHELELENLRTYFEQRLRASGESYREEITLLQLKLSEAALEESVLKTGNTSYISEGPVEEENNYLLAEITSKLEKHEEDLEALQVQLGSKHTQELEQLQATLELQHQENLLQMKTDLTDRYFQEIKELKSKHGLELEQLHAKLSDNHIKEMTRLHLQSAQNAECQVEMDIQQRTQDLPQHYHKQLGQVCSETEPIQNLESQLAVQSEKHSAEIEQLKQGFEEELRMKVETAREEERKKAEATLSQQKEERLAQTEESIAAMEETLQQEATEECGHLKKQLEDKQIQRFQEEQKCLKEQMFQQQEDALCCPKKHREDMEVLRVTMEACVLRLEQLEPAILSKHQVELGSLEAGLRSKHQEELGSLEASLCSKHRSELESMEAGLRQKHQVELLALDEVLHEANLAKLEAQEAELLTRHCRERDELEARLLSNMDTLETSYLAEIQSIRDEKEHLLKEQERLRSKQQAHVQSVREELRRELAQMHMEKFTAMAAELGQAHKEELADALASQRQALEAAHAVALCDLREMHKEEVGALQAQQQQLQELSASSTCELEALRKRLEDGVCQQTVGFQKEVEMLRSQAEEQQLQVSQLKEQLEVEKQKQNQMCEQDQLKMLTQKQEAQLSQVHEEVSKLKGALEGKCSEMATLETLLQRRERENQESSNLVAMLRADLTSAADARKGLQETQERLLKVLVEVLRNILATEDLISRTIGTCVAGEKQDSSQPSVDTLQKGEDSMDADCVPDSSLWSVLTDEGLEMSQRLSESLLRGLELEPGFEDYVLGAYVQLRSAVEKLLELVSESARQLKQTHGVQAELQEQFIQGRDDAALLVLQHQQLLEQLDLEASLKRHLELELHKAEGLMEGYVAEKAVLEEAMQQKESQEQRLAEELEAVRAQLQELTEEHGLLLRQRDTLAGALGEVEKGLLEEVQRLTQEKLDVQRQSEKDRRGLASQLRRLESELEEQESQCVQMEEQRQVQSEDLLQQIQALEKQLKHNRQFIDGQAMEREHEREEFQQEIRKLEAQLKQPGKAHSAEHYGGQKIEDLVLQVETLKMAIKEKMEDYNVLLLTKDKYQQDVAEQNEEIDRMASRIRELEQALMSSTESNRALAELEQELQRAKKAEMDLLQDKEALQQQQYTNRMQISALQSKMDETRHRLPDAGPEQALRDQMEALQQDLLKKEEQVEVLLEQLEQLQRDLTVKEEEVLQLTLQLELLTKQNSVCVSQLQCEVTSLKEEVCTLRKRRGIDKGRETASELQLPLVLLDEKNQEIDHLNQQILHLQQEVRLSKDNKVEAELEELRSQVEHLRGDQQRLRQEHEEEEEQLHEVIQKLQEELAQLGANRVEVSDSPEHSLAMVPRWDANREDSLGRELQNRLDLARSEREALQLLLQSQEEKFRSHVQALEHSLEEEQRRLGLVHGEAAGLQANLSQREAEVERLSTRVQELSQEAAMKEQLETREQQGSSSMEALRAEILGLQVAKEELVAEGEVLRQREAQLQQEVERMEEEVGTSSTQIQQLRSQLEDREAGQTDDHREVLTCAEETLAKAEGALRDKEAQLARLGAEHEALRAELISVKEGLNSTAERAEKLVEEGQTKDKALADLELINQQLKAELTGLQEDLVVQEEELTCQRKELQQLRDQFGLQAEPQTPEKDSLHDRFLSLSPEGSACSPERLRHLACSMDRTAHLSELSALNCTNLELHSKDRSLPPDTLHTDTEPLSTRSPGSVSASETISVMDSLEVDQVKELVQLDLTPPSSPTCAASSPTARDWASDGYGSNMSSELGARLQTEIEATERLDANFLEYLRHRGMTLADSADSVAESDDLLSPELQSLLRKLYREASRILTLSQHASADVVPPSWKSEKRALQQTVLSLRELLCKMADQEPKMRGDEMDWRADLLRTVRSVFATEWDWLRSELHSVLSANMSPDPAPLMEHLEQLLKQQEENQQRCLERLLSEERHSLLSELQSLQAQLRITNLQSQEQLQHLQGCLSAAQEESCQQQHQLRRQVELLEFRLQQEQVLVQELRSSLSAEQNVAAQLRLELDQNHLQVSTASQTQQELHNETCMLRAKLESQTAERVAWESDVRREKANVQELQEEVKRERAMVQELQEDLKREQQCGRLRLEQEAQNLEGLRHALEQEQVLTSNLRKELQIEQSRCEALIAQERRRSSEVLSELEEAHTHCSQLRHSLTQEKQEKQELMSKLEEVQINCTHLTHALSQEKQEFLLNLDEVRLNCKQLTHTLSQEKEEKQELVSKLEEVRSECSQLMHALSQEKHEKQELLSKLEEVRSECSQIMHTLSLERKEKQELIQKLQEVHKHCAQVTNSLTQEKEELTLKLQQAAQMQMEASSQEERFIQELQSQLQQERRQGEEVAAMLQEVQQQALRSKQQLEAERLQASELQAVQKKQRDRRRQQEQLEKEQLYERACRRLVEMERQQEQDQQRIVRLQQALELERRPRSDKESMSHPGAGLQITQQQLRLAIVRVADLLHGSRKGKDSGLVELEDDLEHLRRTLADLEQDLEELNAQGSATTAVMEQLLGEKAELNGQLGILSQEKAALQSLLSCAQKELQAQKHIQSVREQAQSKEEDVVQLGAKLSWQKERAALQAALHRAEAELSQVTAEIENRPLADSTSSKVQRLYVKYLRAESFRKALVYQKKYLLLLLGGFQDCEQVTLSLIARMGVSPSPALACTRPINRFRTTVRVIIAISRLRFLVKKWQKSMKKGHVTPVMMNGRGPGTGSSGRLEVLRQQHPGVLFNSPPTHEYGRTQRGVISPLIPAPKSPFSLVSRPFLAERPGTPQDPERSLSEYIQHLEAVQLRLGAAQKGSPVAVAFPASPQQSNR